MQSVKESLQLIEKLHNDGQSILLKAYGSTYPKVTMDQVVAVCPGITSDICDYNLGNRIDPKANDTTKWVAFGAAALVRRYTADYNAVPLFFGYFYTLDETLEGTGMTIRSMGDMKVYCENLQGFLKQGQHLAPFCFLRGMDLAFDRCALPAIGSLKINVSQLQV